MIKVTDVVLDLIQTDELALESLRAGLLNLSAFADKIQQRVENATKKPVQKGTIVVALSRIAKNIPKAAPLTPELRITNLSITSSLSVLSYDKTPEMQRKISVLHPFTLAVQDMFSVTEGPTEVTVICSEKAKDKLVKHFGSKPKAEYNDVVAVTCEIDRKIIDTPNIFHVLFNALATKRIDIVEIVSTYTGIVFLVRREDMEPTLSTLNTYFKKEKI